MHILIHKIEKIKENGKKSISGKETRTGAGITSQSGPSTPEPHNLWGPQKQDENNVITSSGIGTSLEKNPPHARTAPVPGRARFGGRGRGPGRGGYHDPRVHLGNRPLGGSEGLWPAIHFQILRASVPLHRTGTRSVSLCGFRIGAHGQKGDGCPLAGNMVRQKENHAPCALDR